MRVLITTTNSLGLNGVSNVILNYYRNMTSENIQFDFVVVNFIDNKIEEELVSMGSIVYKLPMRNRNPIKYIKKLTAICKKGQYDIIHSHGNSNTLALEMVAAKRAKVKIRIAHSHATNCKNKMINFLLRPLFMKSFTHGFACSDVAGEWLFFNKKYYVINNAFNIDKFKFNENVRKRYREELGINQETVIGHVGAFTDTKNHYFLLKVFKEYHSLNPNSKLVLVGGGNKEKITKHLIDLDLRENVLILGSRNDVELIINAFDVFVFPSKSEGLGIVLLEAQANGLPVLASDVIPPNVKVLDSFKFVSLKEGAKKWAELIDSSVKSRYIEGYKLIKESGYDIEREAKKLQKLYYKLISEEK